MGISIDLDVAMCAAASIVLLAVICVVIIVRRRRRRGRKCPNCGASLSKRTKHCTSCGAPLARQAIATPQKAPPRSQAAQVELVVVEGPLAHRRVPIPQGGLTIGRQDDNDIVLDSELMVSRHHAIITLEQDQYVLYDRDSANGTWVNDQRVFRHVLVPGDRIQIWQSQFSFNYPGVPVSSPPPAPVVSPVTQVEGEQFAGYYLEDLIGRGGMSEVFRARDHNGLQVAIKILQQSDPYLVDKFVQEGNKIGPLLRDHPNIVYVHEFGQGPDNRLYIVMEYVDAPSLRQAIRQSPGEAQIIKIMGQVCGALGFAHQNNVVHRDIKPENILLTPAGKAMVLDFGIAKLTSASTVTRDKIVGTPEYISPEQARGEQVRPASDVYSLGIVLYELLAGSVPFRRKNDADPFKAAMEVIRQHLKENPEPVRKRNPNATVSKKLERVTMRSLKKDIRDRYETASEMGKALGYKGPAGATTSPNILPQATLLIVKGSQKGRRIRLTGDALALGRLDIDPKDTSMSRHHVSIIFRGGAFWLQDMSKNGTWIDNKAVFGEAPLKPGALIQLGDNVLRLEM